MDAKDKHAPSTATLELAVLVLVTFFTALYMKGLNSGIPLYYDSIGDAATVGGTLVAVFTLASTVMRLVGGQVTDHFSHYRVLLASLAGLLIGVAIPAVCDAFPVVMASRILQGASFALATNVMTVAVMGSASKKHLGRRVGIKGAGTSLGTMLGALVATGLLDGIGYQGFYGFYAALMLAAMLAIVLLKRKENAMAKAEDSSAQKASEEAGKKASDPAAPDAHEAAKAAAAAQATTGENATGSSVASGTAASAATASGATAPGSVSHVAPAKQPFRERARQFIAPYLFPQVMPYLAISFARRMPKGFCIAFVLIFARAAGIASGALFFVAAGATTLICRLCGGKLFDSGRTWLLFPLISVQILGFAALAVAPSFATLIVAAIGYGISVGTTSPFIKTTAAKATPKEHWGVVNGEIYFFGDLGKALGAFLGGLIIDATAKALVPEIALGFALFTSVVTGLSLLIGHRMNRKRELAA